MLWPTLCLPVLGGKFHELFQEVGLARRGLVVRRCGCLTY
jgi:hypothetical protein